MTRESGIFDVCGMYQGKSSRIAWTVGRREGSEAEAGGDEGVRQIEINENEDVDLKKNEDRTKIIKIF